MADYLDLEELRQRGGSAEERDVAVEAWGGTIRLRGLTRKEVYEIAQAANPNGEDSGPPNPLGDILTIIRGSVQPKFTDDDVDFLMNEPIGVTQPLMEAVMELSKLRDVDTKSDSG